MLSPTKSYGPNMGIFGPPLGHQKFGKGKKVTKNPKNGPKIVPEAEWGLETPVNRGFFRTPDRFCAFSGACLEQKVLELRTKVLH